MASVGAVSIRTELKNFDSYSTQYVVAGPVLPGLKFDGTGTMKILFAPLTGNGAVDRLGRKCNIKSVEIRGIMYSVAMAQYTYTTLLNGDASNNFTAVGGSAGTTYATVAALQGVVTRLMLIYDKQPNHTVCTISDVNMTSTNLGVAHSNINNRERFVNLMDKIYTWSGIVSDITKYFLFAGKQSRAFKFYRNFEKDGGLEVSFNSTSASSISSIERGALYLISIGGSGGLTSEPYMDFSSRCMFTDMKSV